MKDSRYYTLRGYDMMDKAAISPTMEDYLEMIYRQSQQDEYVRVNMLAKLLNVKPSSASKMAAKLREAGLVITDSGLIRLTPEGSEAGAYLVHRHRVLNEFFRMVNGSQDELELVERIEHYIDERTLKNLERLTEGMKRQAE